MRSNDRSGIPRLLQRQLEGLIGGGPLLRRGQSIGTLTLLDRRDGLPYGPEDVSKAQLFADLAVSAL